MPIRALLPDEDMRGRFAITMGRKAATSLTNREPGDKRSSKSGKSVAASNLARREN
jgi:hypothetical protein